MEIKRNEKTAVNTTELEIAVLGEEFQGRSHAGAEHQVVRGGLAEHCVIEVADVQGEVRRAGAHIGTVRFVHRDIDHFDIQTYSVDIYVRE